MDDDPLPKVTLRHLTRAEQLCPRRMAREHANRTGTRAANAAYRVANQLTEDVRLVHTGCTRPVDAHLRPTDDLAPEQQTLYRLAARWYVELYGNAAVRVLEDGDAEWETEIPELGVRLVGKAGLACEDELGRSELRLLRFGDRRVPLELVDTPVVRFALLRRAAWIGVRTVHVTVADLMFGGWTEQTLDGAAALVGARAWLAERTEVIRRRVGDARPRLGIDCSGCPFIAGCEAHA